MNIYCGNLSYNCGDDDLNELFGQYGEVTSARVIADKFTGRSRGFGFVEMADDEAANKAIAELNGKMHMDRELKINEAKPKEDRPSFDR